jgi:hypothetical protein
MRGKKLFCAAAIALLIVSGVSFGAAHKLTRIGVNTFAQIKGSVPTAQVMKTIAQNYAGDIKLGLDKVGQGDIYIPFLDQLKAAVFVDKAIPVGDKFIWMFFRVAGKVQVWEDVEWAGKAPLDVFSFNVTKDNKIYEYVIPKPCGNIALYQVSDVKLPPPPPPTATCNLVVSPAKANVNEPISVDMSGTRNAVSMDVEVFTAQGTKVGAHTFTPAAPKWQTKFEKPGEYVFKAKAVNAAGVASVNACQSRTYVNFPPVCKLWTSCLPCQDYVGKPITFDASGSTDADGQVVKASFQLTDESGNVIDSFTKTEKPFVWEKVFKKAGKYAISVLVFDDMGAVSSAGDPCKLTFEVTQKKFFFLAEFGGLLARGTYTGYGFGRLGLMYTLAPDIVDLIVRAGGALPTQGSPWKFIWMADALLNLHLGDAAYIDGGLGYSSQEKPERKGGLDLIGAFGVNLFNNFTSAGSIFAEVRIPVITADRDWDNHHKLLLGFRYIF